MDQAPDVALSDLRIPISLMMIGRKVKLQKRKVLLDTFIQREQ